MSKKFFYAISFFALLFLFPVTSSLGTGPKEGKVVFLRGTEVWTAKANGSDLKQLTNDGLKKGAPLWSPDGIKIAYLTDPDPGEKPDSKNPNNRIIAKIVIISEKGDRVSSIPILSELMINAVLQKVWVDNNRYGYEGHINPSLSEYRIVDINSGNIVAAYLGAGFKWSPDRTKLSQIGEIVHFAPSETQNDSVQINKKAVYSLPKDNLKHYINTSLSWSPDSKYLAFIEKHETNGKEILIILTAEGGKIAEWELPDNLKGTRDIEWLDLETILLGKNVLRFNDTKRQIEQFPEETRKTKLALVESQRKETWEREKLVQSLGGRNADRWFDR